MLNSSVKKINTIKNSTKQQGQKNLSKVNTVKLVAKPKQKICLNEKKEVAKTVVKYFLLTLLFYLLNNAKILFTIRPCFYGVFLSFLFFGQNAFYLSLSYLLSVVLDNVSIFSLSFAVFVCIAGGILSYIHKTKIKSFKTYLMVIYAFAIGLFYIVLNLSDLQHGYIAFVNVLFNTLCVLCSSVFLRIIKLRKLNLNLNVDEVVCCCVLIMFMLCGVQNINYFAFDITKFFGVSLVLFFSLVIPNSFAIIFAIVCGLGVMLVNSQMDYVVVFSLVAVLGNVFKNQHKIYVSLSVFIVESLMYLFILNSKIDFFIYILPTFLSLILFMFLPNTVVNKSKQIFYDKGKSDALKSILNQNKIELSKKLLYTAEVFYEMNINFRNMAKNNLDIKTSKTIVCNEIIKQNCQNCSNKIRCLKSFNTEIKDIFEKLINVGFEKGKITLVDLPAYLTNRCVKTSTIVNSFNKLLQEYKQYTKMLSNLDASKLLIADQFGGISHVLSMLAKQANEVTSQNEELQQTIQQNLIYENILPSEIVCFEKDCQTTEVALIVRNIDFDNSKIENVLSKTCGYKMVLINSAIVPNNPGFCCLFYSTAATYDIAVGFAQANKAGEDVCGDTYSILRLSNNKFMLSLCDGMGHGKKARNASDLSISLIENFYKAGFDNQTILTSVNSLLNMGREDTFSALDVSVIDLKSGEVDFIKQGATVGFIKNSKEINKIQSNSLPIGILQKVSPKITKTILSTEDIVIMLSDGVVDAFGEEQTLIDYLTRLPLKTPQEMANAILNKAKLKQKNYPKDDMTVLVGKLFFNCA